MTIDELAANREWMLQVRADFEATLRPEDRDAPATKSLIHYMLRLLDITLDYHSRSMQAAAAGKLMTDQEIRDWISTANVLGKQWSGSLEDVFPHDALPLYWVYRLYAEGLTYIAREAADDPMLTDFLHLALVTWGAFYSRAEIHD